MTQNVKLRRWEVLSFGWSWETREAKWWGLRGRPVGGLGDDIKHFRLFSLQTLNESIGRILQVSPAWQCCPAVRTLSLGSLSRHNCLDCCSLIFPMSSQKLCLIHPHYPTYLHPCHVTLTSSRPLGSTWFHWLSLLSKSRADILTTVCTSRKFCQADDGILLSDSHPLSRALLWLTSPFSQASSFPQPL